LNNRRQIIKPKTKIISTIFVVLIVIASMFAATALAGKPTPPPTGSAVISYNVIPTTGIVDSNKVNLGSVSITVPTNGKVHITLTGYVYFTPNSAMYLGIDNTPTDYNLDYTLASAPNAGAGTSYYYSLSSQAVVDVIAGTTTFYAVASGGQYGGTLYNVKMTAVFYPA
jgi:hypothetical protein